MSGFRIRLATEADSDRIALIQRAAAEEGARYRGSRLVPTEEPREGFVLVGEADGEVLGSLGCSRTGETTWSIDRVHVLEDARGIGMGDAMVRSCADEVVLRGGTELVSSAQPGDRSLKNLFERKWMVARTILLGRNLSGPASWADVSR